MVLLNWFFYALWLPAFQILAGWVWIPKQYIQLQRFYIPVFLLVLQRDRRNPSATSYNNAHIGRSFLSMKLWRRGWHFKGEPEGKRGRSWHRRMSGMDTRHLWTGNTKCCLSVYHKHVPHTVLSPILMSPAWIIEVIGKHWTSIVQAHICCCL